MHRMNSPFSYENRRVDPSSANSYRRFPASFSVDFLLWVYGTELKPGGPTPRMRNLLFTQPRPPSRVLNPFMLRGMVDSVSAMISTSGLLEEMLLPTAGFVLGAGCRMSLIDLVDSIVWTNARKPRFNTVCVKKCACGCRVQFGLKGCKACVDRPRVRERVNTLLRVNAWPSVNRD